MHGGVVVEVFDGGEKLSDISIPRKENGIARLPPAG